MTTNEAQWEAAQRKRRPTRYIITIRRPQFGLEEYDGGTTLAEARREAKFFAENTPSTVPVKICKVLPIGLKVVEVIRW